MPAEHMCTEWGGTEGGSEREREGDRHTQRGREGEKNINGEGRRGTERGREREGNFEGVS